MEYFTKEGLLKLRKEYELAIEEYEYARKQFSALENDAKSIDTVEFCALNMYANKVKVLKQQIENIENGKVIIIEETPEFKNWDGKTIIRKCEVLLNIGGEVEAYKILGSNEADFDNNILSCNAPLVLALIGHKIGDVVNFNNAVVTVMGISPVMDKTVEKVLV